MIRAGSSNRLWSALPPLVAFLLVNVTLWIAAAADGFDYFDVETWIRWDSVHYLAIAQDGYTYFDCLHIDYFNPIDMGRWLMQSFGMKVPLPDGCGNAGWFPGYPGMIRALSVTGLSAKAAGLLIAIAGQLATLYAVWLWYLRKHPAPTALLALTTAAFFFGHVYYRALFPMSVMTFLLVAHLYLMSRDRWIAAGAVGAVAAFTYPTGFLLAPVSVLWLLVARMDLSMRAKLKAGSWVASLTMLGFVAVLYVQWLQTNVWGAFFAVQSQFGYGLVPAWRRLGRVIDPLLRHGFTLEGVPNMQNVLVGLMVITLVSLAIWKWKDLTSSQRWVTIAVAVYWIFPLMLGGRSSLYRIESVLLPSVILLPKAPLWLQSLIAAAALALAYPMALLFFRNILI